MQRFIKICQINELETGSKWHAGRQFSAQLARNAMPASLPAFFYETCFIIVALSEMFSMRLTMRLGVRSARFRQF